MSWSIESGHWHKCPLCNQRYSDSDGGCDCNYEICQECHKPFEAESDDKVYCPHCEAEMLAAAARDAESDMRLALMDQKEQNMKVLNMLIFVVMASLALMGCTQSTAPVIEEEEQVTGYYCEDGKLHGDILVDSVGVQYVLVPVTIEAPAETTTVYARQNVQPCED